MSVRLKATCLALVALAAIVSARDLVAGRRITAVRAMIEHSVPAGRDRLLAAGGASAAAATPLEALARATLWIDQAAQATTMSERRRALDQAEAMLAWVRTVRAEMPDATLLQVRADLVRFGQPRASTFAAFAQSYRQAGFLRQQGLWRLAFAVTYWPLLSAATHRAVIEEAIWLVRLDGRLRPVVDQLVAGTPPAVPIQLRLLERLR